MELQMQNSEISDNQISPIIRNNKYGFVDTNTNKLITDYHFDFADLFSEGLAAVRVNKVLNQPNSESSESVRRYGYIGKDGNMVIPFFECNRAEKFSDGMAVVSIYDNKNILRKGYIDRTGKMTIPAHFDTAESFSNGFGQVTLNKKCGFVDKSGQLLGGRCDFDLTYDFGKSGRAMVVLNDRTGYIDINGIVDWETHN